MMRSVFSKMMQVGRVTALTLGVAVMVALSVGLASEALSKNGQSLILGKGNNVATKVTGLIGRVATGPAFLVKNPKGGPGLKVQVNAGQAPLTVNADAGKATNLDADKLDGEDSTAFMPIRTYQSGIQTSGQEINGVHNAEHSCPEGDTMLSGGVVLVDEGTHISHNATANDADSWEVRWINDDTADSIGIRVLCADTQ